MSRSEASPKAPTGRLKRWLLAEVVEDVPGPEAKEGRSEQHPWWQVVCLTGVDYFSTLGYIPGIAALAAGALSPIATLFIVLLTLFGALPMYRRVAEESPHGQGSISMLERLLSFWKGKVLVLCLLGFVATGLVGHDHPLGRRRRRPRGQRTRWCPPSCTSREVLITLVLLAVLGAIFLKGFKEAIGIAVFIVGAYLLLNLVVVGVGFYEIATHPQKRRRLAGRAVHELRQPPVDGRGLAARVPAAGAGALGLRDRCGHDAARARRRGGRSRASRGAHPQHAQDAHRRRPDHELLPDHHEPRDDAADPCPGVRAPGGSANGRALAYVAHNYLGDAFGTVYDLSTILILAFAGASAMAGLLNIVPRYLPRYGMAPEWARAIRPLVLVYTAIAVVVTIIFSADVDAQAGAYATGVLAMMSSAAFAVTLSAWRGGSRLSAIYFGLVTAVFVYALVANEIKRPDGIVISLFFIGAIVATSLVSRVYRSLELRQERIELDETALRFIEEASHEGEIHIVANRRQAGDKAEYDHKETEQREDNHIPEDVPIIFLEVDVEDASEFEDVLEVRGVEVSGHKVLRAKSSVVPNAIAALLLHLRDTTGKAPALLLRVDGGQPHRVPVPLPAFRRGGYRPRHPRGLARSRTGRHEAPGGSRRRQMIRTSS